MNTLLFSPWREWVLPPIPIRIRHFVHLNQYVCRPATFLLHDEVQCTRMLPFKYNNTRYTVQSNHSNLHPHASVAFIPPPVKWVWPSNPPNLSDRPVSACRPRFGRWNLFSKKKAFVVFWDLVVCFSRHSSTPHTGIHNRRCAYVNYH